MSKEPIILPRVENILGMATMKLLKLDVVDGKAIDKYGVNADDSKEDDDEDELENEEDKEKEKKKKDKGNAQGKQEEVKKCEVSKKRKTPPPPTRRRSVRRRVASKQTESVTIHIDADTDSDHKEAKGEASVPRTSSKGPDMDESSANMDSMLQMILKTVKALAEKQEGFINTTNASLAELQSQITDLKANIAETRSVILEKVDSITVEEVPVDPVDPSA